MSVWEIMSIDRSLTEIRNKLQQTAGFGGESLETLDEQPQKRLGTVGCPDAHAEPSKTIDPQLDRSLEKNDLITDQENSQIVTLDPITQPCRDCPEGMEW
jgi:hypothetical protein